MDSVVLLDTRESATERPVAEPCLAKRLAVNEALIIELRAELAAREAHYQAKIDGLSEQVQRSAFIRSDLEAEVRKATKQISDLQTELRSAEESHMVQSMELTSNLRDTLRSLDDSEIARKRLEDRLQDREVQLQQRLESVSGFDEELRHRVTLLEAQEVEQAARHAAREAELTTQIEDAARNANGLELGVGRLKTQIDEQEVVNEAFRQQLDRKQHECYYLSERLEEACKKLQEQLKDRPFLIDKCLVASGLYTYLEQRDPKLQKDILGTLLDTMELSADDDRRLRQCSRSMRERHEADIKEQRRRGWGQLAAQFVNFLNEEAGEDVQHTESVASAAEPSLLPSS